MIATLRALGRNQLMRVTNWHPNSSEPGSHDDARVAAVPDANLVSSKLVDSDKHTVVLDLDIPASLVPSTTFGHSHLYIDKELTWEQYGRLLAILADVGIIEKGYHGASLSRGYTAVRLPWIPKDDLEPLSPFAADGSVKWKDF